MMLWMPRGEFQSTLPARGATVAGCNHHCKDCQFQSTLPARGATIRLLDNPNLTYISIHAPRTGSDADTDSCKYIKSISIHAPRTGSDAQFNFYGQQSYISIHAPRTGSDRSRQRLNPCAERFQSTLPARGATCLISSGVRFSRRISIHAPRTGSDPPRTRRRLARC